MKKTTFILAMIFCPSIYAATLTSNTVPYVCQGGANPQLCNSAMTTDSNGNIISGPFVPSNIQEFTSSGTWIKPANVSKVYVKVWGAGASGEDAGNINGAGGSSSFAGSTTIQATGGSANTGGVGSGGSVNLTGGTATEIAINGSCFLLGGLAPFSSGFPGGGGQDDYSDGSQCTNGSGGGGYSEGVVSVTGNVTVTVGLGGTRPGASPGQNGMIIVY